MTSTAASCPAAAAFLPLDPERGRGDFSELRSSPRLLGSPALGPCLFFLTLGVRCSLISLITFLRSAIRAGAWKAKLLPLAAAQSRPLNPAVFQQQG